MLLLCSKISSGSQFHAEYNPEPLWWASPLLLRPYLQPNSPPLTLTLVTLVFSPLFRTNKQKTPKPPNRKNNTGKLLPQSLWNILLLDNSTAYFLTWFKNHILYDRCLWCLSEPYKGRIYICSLIYPHMKQRVADTLWCSVHIIFDETMYWLNQWVCGLAALLTKIQGSALSPQENLR